MTGTERAGARLVNAFVRELTVLLRRAVSAGILSFVIAAAVLICPMVSVRAGDSFQPISQDELKMTSEPLAPGADAIVLYRQVDRDDNGLTSHEDNYVRIKILKEEGRKYADVEIPFNKSNQDIAHLRARTIRPDGTVVEFSGKTFDKSIVKARGYRYIAKTFTLPDVQAGGIIEYFYTVNFREHLIFDSNWILSQDLFTKDARFSLKPYRGAGGYLPLNLRWNWHDLPLGSEPKEGSDHIIRMEAKNIPAFHAEDYMPPADELKARVNFIYSEDSPEKDVDSFWRKLGKKRNAQLEGFVGKHKAMEEAVGQIVSPNDPPELKLRKIYERVQSIRNTSFEISKTEQEEKREKEKTAENVEDILKRGYGNGMQLTWLYLALVRAAGIEAYGVWVSDRERFFFNRATMESGRLDDNVVLVKLNGKDLYFDPGSPFAPFGLLPWAETGVQGLRLDKDGGTWVTTTLPESSESRIDHVAQLTLTDTGDLEGKLRVTYTGLEAMHQRFDMIHSDEVARKKFLEDAVKYEVPVGLEVELTNHPDWTNSETPLVAEFSLKVPGWVSSAGKRALVPAGLFTANEKRLFEHSDRVHPIYFWYPYEKSDDITIELPSGWQVGSVPPVRDQGKGMLAYGLKVESGKNTIHLNRKLKVDFLMLEQKYYPALRGFFQGVKSADEAQVVLQPGAASARN